MSDDPAASTESTTQPANPHGRTPDLVLASVHLRMGSYALARAELETLAGRDALDDGGILDLAEARWRTGDVEGAGEAAALVLDEEDGPLVALIVAAEAAAARGRPTEARRLAAKALAAANGSIDRVFAGMPRSQAWPPDPAAPPPSPTTMFDPPHGTTPRTVRQVKRPSAPVAAEGRQGPPPGPIVAGPVDAADTMGLWDDDATHEAADLSLPSATEALELGEAALAAGDLDRAAIHLALVLRLSSPLAPAVLDLIGDRPEAALAFVRGDAFRLVGRELDARRAYARAAGPASSADSQVGDPLSPADEATSADTDPHTDQIPEGDRP
jgi:tetratricopeptide (TPR) repeat protein